MADLWGLGTLGGGGGLGSMPFILVQVLGQLRLYPPPIGRLR